MIKYAHVFDMRFIGHVKYNFTFHDHFARFSDIHGSPRDVKEIIQIMCPAFHVHPMSSKGSRSKSYSFCPNFESLYLRVCITDNCTFVFELKTNIQCIR